MKSLDFINMLDEHELFLSHQGDRRLEIHYDEARQKHIYNRELQMASFEGADLYRTVFQCCDLRAVNFKNANLSNVEFINCDLRYAQFDFALIDGLILFDCKTLGANLEDACKSKAFFGSIEEPRPQVITR